MAIVNYVREDRAFMEYARDNNVTGNERHFWRALFRVFNDRSKAAKWPDDFISISNKELLSWLPYSEDSMIKARNRLAQRGIIKYKPGQKNTANPMYKMVYFFPEQSPIHQSYQQGYQHSYPQTNESIPQNTGNMQGNIGGNMQGNIGGNMQGNVPDITLNLNVKQTQTTVNTDGDGVSTQRLVQRTREDDTKKALDAAIPLLTARERLYLEWLEELDDSISAKTEFMGYLCKKRFTDDQISNALSLVQSKQERQKVGHAFEYLKAVLYDWEKHGIRDRFDIMEYIADSPIPSNAVGCALYDIDNP